MAAGDPTRNSLDYAYANPLPATNVGSNAKGAQSLGSVVESGVIAQTNKPFVGGLGTPTETSHQVLNPAYAVAEELTHGGGQQQAQAEAPTAEGGLGPRDAAGDVPGNVNPPREDQPTDHSAQIPNAPVITSAVAGGSAGHATVTWTHAADADGYALSGYTVTATSSDGGAGATKTVAGNVLTADVTGLTSTKHYTFTVHATNQAGNSAESAASAAVVAP